SLNATDKAGNGIRVSGIGYVPGFSEQATVVGAASDSFSIADAATGSVIHTGTLSAPRFQESTDETVRVADFSAFTTPGTYVLKVSGIPDSAPFRIGLDTMNLPMEAMMLGFYNQRCGVPVKFEWNGDTFSHPACHTEPSFLDYYDKALAGQTKDATGGWHDAGDYGKYTVNSAFTCAVMLQAWERNGANLKSLAIGVPDAGDGLPYYLSEIKFNLDWMLKLQMEDGRVSHKVTPLNFCGQIMPEDETAPTYFAPWSKLANVDFAAVGCMVARVYRPYDAAYADKWLAAAKKAWLAQRGVKDFHPDLSAFHTGAYDVRCDSDYKWAVIEIALTFGEDFLSEHEKVEFHGAIDDDNRMFTIVWDWGNGYNLGLYDFLFSEEAKKHPEILARMKTDLLAAADAVVTQSRAHGYGRGMRVMYWGCNGAIARHSMSLHAAYLLTGDKKYLDTAMDQISYLFGRNPFSRSFVTGVGINPPLFPH
ncbi:MAG TPA: glycoside hydrolase family 9 protein, partial [Opitutales bacterium]|nr:glycoside hydrolase family 9 protein [Opitutales bacterium]